MHNQKYFQDMKGMVEAFEKAIPANSLQQADPSGVWVIGSILPRGVTILQGGPLIGKTWLALKMGLAVADPEHSNGLDVAKRGTVLYIRYESSESEVRERLEDLFPEETLPSNLMVLGDWPTGGKGLRTSKNAGIPFEVTLQAAKTAHPDLVLVIVDTVVHFSPVIVSRNYELAKNMLKEVKEACEKLEVSVLFVHHTSKQSIKGSPSPYSGLGTMAVAGGTGSIIDLRLDEKKGFGTLTLFSHYVGQKEMSYRLDQDGSGLEIEETVFDTHMTAARVQILGVFARDPEKVYRPSDISTALGKDFEQSAPRTLLNRLLKASYLEKPDRGLYRITEGGLKAYEAHRFLLDAETPLAPLEESKPEEPSAENSVVVVDEPVIEPELKAGSPAEPKVDTPKEADAPEGSSPGDHGEGKEEAGPNGPPLPSEDNDAALVPHTQEGQASLEAPDREAFEAARDAIGFRTLKLDTEYGNDTREALKQEYKVKFIDCSVRGKSAFLAAESEPYSFESMVMDGELGKTLKRYSESQCLEALDLFVELAERGLLIHLKDWNRKFELRPVKEGHASIERPDGVATTLAERFSSSPPEILPRLESLEPVLCALMSEKGWEAVSNFIQGRYLSRWESGVLFDAFFNKRRPSTASLGTGLKRPERFHRLLIACQEPENSGLVCLRHDPSQFVFPLRRRQIRESLGLPTWPGDRTAR